jgi:hypothetical protein
MGLCFMKRFGLAPHSGTFLLDAEFASAAVRQKLCADVTEASLLDELNGVDVPERFSVYAGLALSLPMGLLALSLHFTSEVNPFVIMQNQCSPGIL